MCQSRLSHPRAHVPADPVRAEWPWPGRVWLEVWIFRWESSGDTIPNRLGEFREIRESNERVGIAAYGHPGAIRSIFSTCNALGQDGLPTLGMVQKRPFSGNTRDLSADPDRSRVGAGLRESLVAVLGLQFRENRVYPRSFSQ